MVKLAEQEELSIGAPMYIQKLMAEICTLNQSDVLQFLYFAETLETE